ncbi:hypothetical protein ACLIBH_12335 [Virgibacillus sp. W0430]|uniref:hypothetical protein n=1 Tax=Virgibacillus sp. W0430 TaxID=3391580 RepID=UPI003F456308
MPDKQSREGLFSSTLWNDKVADELAKLGIKTHYPDGSMKSIKGILSELSNIPPIQGENSKSVGSFHVDIDCSNALKGLKAVQREAKKATAALKELEVQQSNIDIPVRPEVSE